MREAIGGTWLFNLVIFFVLLFTGYMCLSINYSKAFSVKDKIITEIERNGGIKNISNSDKKDETMNVISDYLNEVGYRTTGKCSDYEYGCSRDGKCTSNPSGSYAFCLTEVKASDTFTHATSGEFIYVNYYKVKVFYQLDLPVIRSAFEFNIKGDTKLLYDIENA
jgi:hypothetical protein